MEKKFTDFVPLEEGVNDPAIFTIFLAGESLVLVNLLLLEKLPSPTFGYKVINSDDAFEKRLKEVWMEMTLDNIFSTKGQSLRDRAPTSPNNASLIIFKVDLVWLLTELARTTKKLKRRKSN